MKFSGTTILAFALAISTSSAFDPADYLLGFEDCDVCFEDASKCIKASCDRTYIPVVNNSAQCPIEDSTECFVPPLSTLPYCIEHDGLQRCWMIHVPEKVTSPPKLVVNLHGADVTAMQEMKLSGWTEKSEEEGFIVATPQGYYSPQELEHQDVFVMQLVGMPTWNAGALPGDGPLLYRGCCGDALTLDIDDVGFLRKLVMNVTTTHGIDPSKHVYWTGESNGCGMAQRMAAEASDIVAAMACQSMFLMKEKDNFPYEQYQKNGAVSVLMIHGDADPDIVYEENSVAPFLFGAKNNRENWASYNGCKDYDTPNECYIPNKSGDEANYTILSSTNECDDGTEAALLTLHGVGHTMMKGESMMIDENSNLSWLPGSPDMVPVMWNFMKRFPEEEGGGSSAAWHGECATKPDDRSASTNSGATPWNGAEVWNTAASICFFFLLVNMY